MRWPWSSDGSGSRRSDDGRLFSWKHFQEPRNIAASVVLAGSTLVLVRFYKTHLRRIPTVSHIKPDYYRSRSLFGKVTTVGDADGFRIFHTPGGRLAGWGWLPGRLVPSEKKDLAGKTIPVRIAGIDAPEMAHFGKEAQPYADAAYQFLTSYILGRRVRVHLLRKDQYDRVVGTIYVRRWGFKKDVGLEMLKKGLATVYEARTGAEFGGQEDNYRHAEEVAQKSKVGMWEKPGLLGRLMGAKAKKLESPREYKDRMKEAETKKK